MSIKEVLVDTKTTARTFPASTAVAVGDLLWDNSGTMAKASAQTDQLTEPANQRLFAAKFAGVSMSQRLATETATGTRTVSTDGVYDCTCPSTTWAVGDLVGASENAGGTALEDQQVEKVTDPTLAIGYCVKAGTSLTTVRVRLIANAVHNQIEQRLIDTIGGGYKTVNTDLDDTATATIIQLLKGIIDAVPTGAATFTLPTAALLVAGMPGAKVGDTFWFIITNNSAGANTITVAAGSGGTADGTLTVAQNVVRMFVLTLTNVTASSEAYTVYGIG